MRKLILAFLAFIILLLVVIYFFIPNVITFNENLLVKANGNGVSRKLLDEKTWQQFLSEKSTQQNPSPGFVYNHSLFSVNTKTSNPSFVVISNNTSQANTSLYVINKNSDTAQLNWIGSISTSYNPFKRIQNYYRSKKITQDIDSILKRMQCFFSKTENVYDYTIQRGIVSDSLLVSTYINVKGYPSVENVYELIDKLKKYIADHGAKETGFPMLNVSTNDSVNFLTKVAIPVNMRLPSSTNISFKQMLAGGNILTTDIKGGPGTIFNAFNQMENYISDYHQSAPAIPFQSLITDRRKEPDTSKWQTKIYYPVM